MPRKKLLLSIYFLSLPSALPCYAENWGMNGKNELPPASNENRIIKWCDDQRGENIRFSSANIKVKGYHPCGSIVSSSRCDGEGNKVLGNPKSGIFTDCKDKKNDSVISQPSDSNSSVKPLSHSELSQLKSVMKKAADKQNAEPEVALQMLADKLMATFMGAGQEKDLLKTLTSQDTQKMMQEFMSKLEKSLPQMDPESRKFVEPILKNFQKSKW